MHVDINSCFATIEQQANPYLRGKPIAVAAYASSNGCILAPSVEAKRYGIKTGMRVKDGKLLYPKLIVLSPDPWKYRVVHIELRRVLAYYTNHFSAKSIDEFVLHFNGLPILNSLSMQEIAFCIKEQIKTQIGEWITVSVGIGPSRFIAKLAAGIEKPDGLVEINKDNYLEVYSKLKLTDLHGIADRNALRLNSMGIYTVLDFYHSPMWKIKAAFHSISGYYWYTRLRGHEIDDVLFARRTYGNSYSLPKPFSHPEELAPILTKLVEKTSFRMRRAGYMATGVHLAISFRDGGFWHHAHSVQKELFDTRDIYKVAFYLLLSCSKRSPVRNLAVSCFGLVKNKNLQLELFDNVPKRQELVTAVDKVNKRWGNFVITSARMVDTTKYVPDRIAFGNVKELEEFTLN